MRKFSMSSARKHEYLDELATIPKLSTVPNHKVKEAEELRKEVEEYLASGKKITHIPLGVTKESLRKKARSRK